ncbi:P-loop containing nucleoside triphosphate hydrolase protein [Dactylonectria estremocensis]|uniref:P-loop containing nucleoside triphosphate hydrolase protein n=1 Tax=Dactylonectria estremocensis TaxID=1079267 RepID=A0A9P9IJV5_9HYPO|nr:P-loop containing nucleoside triphosphate hydrolase protein [Dactylonectria estremocensis]
MGMTGAGKTTFISKITGLDMEIGHDLQSCTKEIEVATVKIDGYEVCLIDTPGFDDTELKDTDVLLKIAAWLREDVRLSGILYSHAIDARRVGGAAKRNLAMFQNLVGKDNMRNVKLVTTMWGCVTPEVGSHNLDQLSEKFWRPMTDAGAQMGRCANTLEDGERIIQSILRTSPVTLLFQKEIQEGLELGETAAGKTLTDQLHEIQEKHARELKDLQEQMAATAASRDAAETLLCEQYEKKLRQQVEASEQVRKLRETEIVKLQEEVKMLKNGGCVIL